jgi:hypothetical protein
VIDQRIDCLRGGLGGGAKHIVTWCLPVQRRFGFRNPPRRSFRAANADPRHRNFPVNNTISDERRAHRKVTGTTAELVETEPRVVGQHRKPRLRKQLILGQRGRHDTLKKIFRGDHALALHALRHDLRIQRRCNETPFRRWIGVREGAAERAAHPDRIMRDVPHDFREQRAEPPVSRRLVKRGVAHARADDELATFDFESVEPGYFVDVDEMRRPRHPERHDRHEALAAGQHAAVLRRDLGQNLQRLIERPRHVADERRGLHANSRGAFICMQTIIRARGLSNGSKRRAATPPPYRTLWRRW